MTAALVHTGLTVEDVDTINGCTQRLRSAVVLLELGLHIMDESGDDPGLHSDPETIRLALLDVLDRLREDVTLIGARLELAELATKRGDR